jgi:hypothetical protein
MTLATNAVYGYDTVSIQHGNQMSLPERAGAFTVGAVTSAVASFYNTGVAAVNLFGADAEELDIQKRLSAMDRDWGSYYAENKSLIDTVGFIGGAFVPGAVGMKAMQLAKAGKYGGAAGQAVAGKLNFFAERRALNLAKGLEDIASEGGTAYAFVNRNKLAAMGWETADKVLEVAAGELMIAGLMNQSPLLADDSFGEIAKDVAMFSLVGGGILGGIGAFSMNRLFKDTVIRADAVQRKYDTLDTFKALGVGTGDKIYGVVDSLFNLPSSVLESDKLLSVSSNFLGPKSVTLDLSKQLGATINRRDTGALVKLQELFTDNKNIDKETGIAMGEFVIDLVRKGKTAGADVDQIKGVVGEYMFGLKSAHGLHDDVRRVFDDDAVFYVNTNLPLTADGVPDMTKALTRVPEKGGHIKQPYRVVGDMKSAKSVLVGLDQPAKKLQDAWDLGADIAVLPDNSLRINPKSEIIKHLSDDPAFNGLRYLNTRTGQVTEETVVTAADVTRDIATKITKRGVVTDGPDGAFNFKLDEWYDDVASASVTEATARHAWFAKMGDELLSKSDAVVRSNDISALSFLKQANNPKYKNVAIDFGDGDIRTVEELGDSLTQVLEDLKAQEAINLFSAGITDPRAVAYRLNMSEEALSALVGNEFKSYRAANAGTGTALDGMDLPLGKYLKRENVMLRYDVADALPSFAEGVNPEQLSALQKAKGIKPDFIDGEMGWHARVKEAEDRLVTAFHTVVPAHLAAQFQNIDYKELAKLANQTGAGASTLGFANADYSELFKLFAQNTGKLTHRLREEFVEGALMRMQPSMHKIQSNQQAAAELGILDYAMRSSDEQYTLWRGKLPGKEGNEHLIPLRALDETKGTIDPKIIAEVEASGAKGSYQIENREVADFIQEWISTNGDRLERRTQLLNARGYTTSVKAKAFYVPPIDTTKFKHFAFVKEVDGALGSTSEVTMVVARDAAELQQKVAQIPSSRYDVFYKQDTEDFLKAKGLYEQGQTLNSPRVNSDLRRTGKLTDWMPSTRADNVLADYMNFANNSWSNLARESVETRYGQMFEQLRFLGRNYTEAATSQFSGNIAQAKAEAIDPFRDGIRTALDISKRSQYRLLAEANEFVDALGTRAYRAVQSAMDDASKKAISWQEAEKIATRHGVGGAFQADTVAEAYRLANQPYDRNLFRETIAKVNTILANTVLRLDAANSVLNTISTTLTTGTELAAIRSLMQRDPEMAAKFAAATTVAIPGTNGAKSIPSTHRLLFDAAKKYFSDEGKALRRAYYEAGDIKNANSMYHQMMDDLALPSILDNRTIDKISKTADKYVELGAKYTGNNFAEEFTRFVSANIMDQLTEPAVARGLMSKQEAAAYRSIFVNRTQGNYITSQRPIVFQGTIGAAVGLFQTYAFTLMQQLGRHIGNRDARALITFGGLQTGLFGLNGLPFFEAVNTHIIGNASTNDSHSDVYSTMTKALGKEWGDWLMYGTASAFPLFTDKMPALYTRGDVNPRHLTVIPVLPTQMPFVDASIRVAGNLVDTAAKLAKGGDVKNTLLEGLQLNGVSRPLAGVAQAAMGYSSTSKGGLIAANSDLWSIANFSRILGAKPVDEAVALNTLYRQKAYQAKDSARLEFLGRAVKTTLRNNEAPSEEQLQDFLAAYTSVGGRAENYSRALQRWQRDANVSVVNQIMFFHDTPYANRMLEVMEGQALQDFSFNPEQAAPDAGAGQQ